MWQDINLYILPIFKVNIGVKMEYVSIVVIILFIVVIKFALNVKLKDIKKIKESGLIKN